MFNFLKLNEYWLEKFRINDIKMFDNRWIVFKESGKFFDVVEFGLFSVWILIDLMVWGFGEIVYFERE